MLSSLASDVFGAFSGVGFMPHIHGYLDRPSIVWTMFATDMLIGIAYVGISLTLWGLVKRIRIPFNFVVVCFGIFILACGMSHFMEVWNLWNPDYWLAALVKLIAALASVGTGVYLFKLREPLRGVAQDAKLSETRRLELESLTSTLEQRVEERSKDVVNERENLRNLFRQTPEMVCILKGPTHIFEFVNEAHVKALGFDATGMSVREAQPESVEVHGILDNVYRTGETAQLHEIPVTLSDRLRYFSLTYAARRDPLGAINGIMILGIEVTGEVLSREKLKLALSARDEFLSIASHELRTPLTSMKMQTQILQRAMLKDVNNRLTAERLDKFLEQSEKQVDRMARLVDDMLDISRISQGKLVIRPEPMDIGALTKEVADRYSDQSIKNRIEVICDSQIIGNWDRFRIEQVITNLLTNAIRYGKDSPIVFRVFAQGDEAVLKVRDQGIGIAKENQARIFERFERAVTANEVSGLGLGLYIVQSILEMHGGTISVESELGKGSEFTVRLPRFRNATAG